MAARRILVTGAAGFTGGHLARRLVREGHAVRALVRTPGQAERLARESIEPVLGDLRDPESLAPATRSVETVYHIAATFRREVIARGQFAAVNAEGVRHMIEAAIRGGATRFVHCSTIGVHGHVRNPPADEGAPLAPGDVYQETKLQGENIARGYMERGDLAVTIVRPGGIYGPGDLRFLKLFRAIKRRRFVMIGSGETLYHLGYIDDLVDGFILCGTKPQAVGQTYILLGERYTTLNELVALIAAQLGVPAPRLRIPTWPIYAGGAVCEAVWPRLGLEPPLYRRRIDFFVKDRAFDIGKAKRELGYRPRVDLPTGIARVAAWYAREGYL